MSSAVLGTSFSNVSGFALLVGLSSALETLCGQVRDTDGDVFFSHGVMIQVSPAALHANAVCCASGLHAFMRPSLWCHRHGPRLYGAQAYGAQQYELVGVSLQRGSLICGIFFCMMVPVWLNFEPLMLAMGELMQGLVSAHRSLLCPDDLPCCPAN